MMLDMEKPSRDFKGIWIPKEIWESENLSIMEKVLFVEFIRSTTSAVVMHPTGIFRNSSTSANARYKLISPT